MPLPIGYSLVNRYRIVSLLAQGAGGASYRAWDERHSAEITLKHITDNSAETLKHFRKEAQQLNQLKHANLASFIDHFNVDDLGLFLVSEYVGGVTLSVLVAQYGTLPQAQVVEWMQPICEAIQWLHGKGRLHLDIKPANVIIRPNNTPVLVDSGLPGMGIATGTHGYASPEQQSQRDATPASDIYSLSATLYTALTGNIPIDALARETGMVDLKPAREVNEQVEPYLSIIAQRALSLQPDLRFEDVTAFATALSRPSKIPPIPAPTSPSPHLPASPPTEQVYTIPARRFIKQRKRRRIERRTIWGLLAILIILVATATTLGLITLNRQELATERDAIATVTTRSQIAKALTEVAPTQTPIPTPSIVPTATPAPITDEKSGARMIFIPGGSFRMGTDEGDEDNQPLHKVKLDPYFIDEMEVTNGMYSSCVEAGACTPPQRRGATYHSTYYGDDGYDDYPVIFVTWHQSQQFCEWRGGRLPSEAEWEYAAGFKAEVAQKLRFPWGNVMNEANANFCDTNCTDEKRNVEFDDGHRDTAPVGSYPGGVSPFDVHDMSGNVMEWVFDWYSSDYYEISSDINPLGPPDGEAKVLRGGSWLASLDDLAIIERRSFLPEVARANLGFRCVMAPE